MALGRGWLGLTPTDPAASARVCVQVAIFIVQKILLDDMGLNFVCQTYERFLAVVSVFNTMVAQLVEHQALRLLKHVIRCYYRLSDNPR